jgi:nicotinic acid mononucleotide adenylyltransferase
VSSSEIRERVRQHRTISHLVPATVVETIAAKHLYESRPAGEPKS